MTEQHVSLLRRFADKIVLLFDADTAGETAVNRAVELFLTHPIEIGIASMPDGVDPDEFLLEHGTEAFEKLLSEASDALTFKWKQLDVRFRAGEDLTGRQKAVGEYLELLASARGAGPVDSLRWGTALARVSRLTEVSIDELNRRFKVKKGAKPQGTQVERRSETNNRVPTVPVAQDLVERQILGILLAEPAKWHDLQQVVDVADFKDEQRRRLAEMYWQRQRDDGEPVFREFLSDLNDESLKELAVELVEAADKWADLNDTLNQAALYLAEVRHEGERQKQLARVRRNDAQSGEQDEVSQLRKLSEQCRQPNLRRL